MLWESVQPLPSGHVQTLRRAQLVPAVQIDLCLACPCRTSQHGDSWWGSGGEETRHSGGWWVTSLSRG